MSDAQLIRYLHDELSAQERAHIEAQLAASASVAERLRLMRQRSARLSVLLRSADPDPAQVEASAQSIRSTVEARPHTHQYWWHRVPRSLAAAAAMAVLLGGVMLVEPARAWVIEQARAIAVVTGLVDSPPDSPAPTAGPGWRFAFPWSARTFEVNAGAARGTLVIRRGTEPRAIVESMDAGTTRIVVTPTGAVLAGADTTPAAYTFVLPPEVEELRVVYEGSARSYPLARDFTELRVPLR